ncbi:MAG: hypothetical protein ABI318_03250 [Chthoniobacteraceae bacterium]
MWSEHCSYKNTKRELRKFPTTGPLVLVKTGEENARLLCRGANKTGQDRAIKTGIMMERRGF